MKERPTPGRWKGFAFPANVLVLKPIHFEVLRQSLEGVKESSIGLVA